MFNVSGKNAFITGGTSGIGLATAKRLKAAGAHITICGRRDDGHRIAREIGAEFAQFDISQEDALQDALALCRRAHGDIDFVFNNAGFMDAGPRIADAGPDVFRKVVETNLISVYGVLHAAPKHMSEGGSIVNTSSIAAIQTAVGYSRYAATKAAVSSLTKSAALELAPRGIRVNAVAPGSVWTEMLPPDDPEVIVAKVISPFSSIGEPDDVAALAHYLASNEARHVTGSIFTIDAGATAGLGLPLLGLIFGRS